MRLHRRTSVLVALVVAVTGCGRSKTLDEQTVRVVRPTPLIVAGPGESRAPNAIAAADAAIRREQYVLVLNVLAFNRAYTLSLAEARGRAIPPRSERGSSLSAAPHLASAPHSWDWDCVARAETGGNWQMKGSRYSSALGVLNEAVRENAPPAVAARILSGTASRQEQIDMARGIVNRFGERAWASSTVAKCGG